MTPFKQGLIWLLGSIAISITMNVVIVSVLISLGLDPLLSQASAMVCTVFLFIVMLYIITKNPDLIRKFYGNTDNFKSSGKWYCICGKSLSETERKNNCSACGSTFKRFY